MFELNLDLKLIKLVSSLYSDVLFKKKSRWKETFDPAHVSVKFEINIKVRFLMEI